MTGSYAIWSNGGAYARHGTRRMQLKRSSLIHPCPRGSRKTIEESKEEMKGLLAPNNPDSESCGAVRADDRSPPIPNAQVISVVGAFRLYPIEEPGYTCHPPFWVKGTLQNP